MVFQDDFNRADGNLGTATSGQSWWSLNNSVKISGGKAVCTSDIDNWATVNTGVADMRVTARVEPHIFVAFRARHGLGLYGGGGGLLAGIENGNLLLLRWDSGWKLDKNVGLGHSGPYDLEIVADGPNITVKVNGVVQATHSTTAYQSETSVGMYKWATGAGSVDDLAVVDVHATTTTSTTTEPPPPPPPIATIGDLPVVRAFMGDVPVASLEAIASAGEATTTTTTTTSPGGGFLVGDSILYPNYVGEGSVFQRDVSAMPLVNNSAQIAAYLRQQQIDTGYQTAFNIYNYNFPTYIVRSSEMTAAHVEWDHSWHGYPNWTPAEMMGTVFSKSAQDSSLNLAPFLPIPEYAQPAEGTDSSMAVYDADTDTLWEWWHIKKIGVRQWHSWWGSRTLNASQKYNGQADVGSVCAAGLMGSLLQIGIGEVQNGWIDHALGFNILAPHIGHSWPARQDDGISTNPNSPYQGQWGRLNPSLDIETQPWNPLLKMVARAAQTYGITCFDKAGSVVFIGESGIYHQQQTGIDPWQEILSGIGVPEWSVFADFPWEQTQWAPIDWGKP